MSIETAPPDHSAVGEGSKYSSGECIGYDTGADDVPPSPQLSTTCLENASNHGRPGPEQSRTMFGSQYEDHTGRVPMGRLASAGWQEFVLPDGTRYFSNRALNVVADVDLRDAERLTAVTRFLDGDDVETLTQPEWELWLRDSSELTTAFIPRQAWIHHGERMAVFKPTAPDPGELMNEDIDKMESEYQYWLFMVSHPVHALLPPESIAEAIEVLTWFNINRLLPSPRLSPPPFSEEECQELLTELRSFTHVSVQTVSLLRTCVVSTILVRVGKFYPAYEQLDLIEYCLVAWRQGRRYHSATSQDPQNDKSTLLTGISLLRTAGDSIVSFVCSGLSNMSLGHRELVYIVLMAVAWLLALFLA
ncbi:hypothetical protein F5148DRAFT_740835 [Russula earlei]|uniref:Uncharacterized protein n=1 Tax=Russula earlei TaxID=71964 RepID=A0ACC0UCV9_9AGAM|nr:hypothetical protein F5148DRAFT_740835 [Russula earlei]